MKINYRYLSYGACVFGLVNGVIGACFATSRYFIASNAFLGGACLGMAVIAGINHYYDRKAELRAKRALNAAYGEFTDAPTQPRMYVGGRVEPLRIPAIGELPTSELDIANPVDRARALIGAADRMTERGEDIMQMLRAVVERQRTAKCQHCGHTPSDPAP